MRIAVPLAVLAVATWLGVGHSAQNDEVAELPFEILRTGGIPGTTIVLSRLALARDETGFRDMWTQLKVQPNLVDPATIPKVDFDRSMVVAFFGSQGDNCDPYRLTRVIARPDRVTLQIAHQLPWNCTCASMVFEPYIVVRIARTEKPIDFDIAPEIHECR
jgi:hypothetical protein